MPIRARFNSINKFHILLLAIICYSLFFSVLCVMQYQAFFSEEWEDLAIYNQIIWNIAHGNGPYSSIEGSLFYEHPTVYILYPVALFYAIWPHIYNLFFIVSVSLGSGAIPVYLLAKRVSKSENIALYAALLYLMMPLLHFLNLLAFRPVILCIPLLLWAFYFFYKNNFKSFILFALLAMSCYETVAFSIAFFGVYAFLIKRKIQWILTPLALGVVWLYVSICIVYPACGYKDWFAVDYITQFFPAYASKDSVLKNIINFFLTGDEVWRRILSNIRYAWQISGLPFFFLPYLSPLVLVMALPGWLLLMLPKSSLNIGEQHWLAPYVPFLMVAAIFGLQKCLFFIKKWKLNYFKKPFLIVTFFFIFFSNFGNTRYGALCSSDQIHDHRFKNVRNVFNPIFYVQDDQDKIALKLIAMIPGDASVCASGDLLPHLSQREHLYEICGNDDDRLIKNQVAREDGTICLSADFILFRIKSIEHGASRTDYDNFESIERAEKFVKGGYFTYAAKEGDFLLLKKKAK